MKKHLLDEDGLMEPKFPLASDKLKEFHTLIGNKRYDEIINVVASFMLDINSRMVLSEDSISEAANVSEEFSILYHYYEQFITEGVMHEYFKYWAVLHLAPISKMMNEGFLR